LSFETVFISSELAVVGSGLVLSVRDGSQALNALYGYEVIPDLGLGGILVSSTIAIKLRASQEDSGRLSSPARELEGAP
jgi:hypothetical protein